MSENNNNQLNQPSPQDGNAEFVRQTEPIVHMGAENNGTQYAQQNNAGYSNQSQAYQPQNNTYNSNSQSEFVRQDAAANNQTQYAQQGYNNQGQYAQQGHNGPAGGNNGMPNAPVPGKNFAIASLVLGIISVVCWFGGYSALLSIVLGIIGIVLASKSKAQGFNSGIRTAGFVLSIIGLVGGGIFMIACIACVGSVATLAEFGSAL